MDLMDWMTPSSSLFLARTTKAPLARGLETSGSRQPSTKTLSYFSLIFLCGEAGQHAGSQGKWALMMANSPDGWRSASGHQDPPWRVGMPHEEDQDENDDDEGEEYDNAERYGDGRIPPQAERSSKEFKARPP